MEKRTAEDGHIGHVRRIMERGGADPLPATVDEFRYTRSLGG